MKRRSKAAGKAVIHRRPQLRSRSNAALNPIGKAIGLSAEAPDKLSAAAELRRWQVSADGFEERQPSKAGNPTLVPASGIRHP